MPGQIYIAPGDYHMTIENGDNGDTIKLDQNPPVNFCRPAIDPMLESVVKIHGKHTLVVILTGMGYDGLNGSKLVNQAGGTVIGQDEETSVVWGMPGAVAGAGICNAVLPLKQIAPQVLKYFNKVK